MRTQESTEVNRESQRIGWGLRDSVAAAVLFAASAAQVLWQNAHLTVLWDASYTLETSARIALGQMPYRDFPLAHAPLTFLIQAAIIRLTGRVFIHSVIYAAIMNGLGTLLAWRIVLGTLHERMRGSWAASIVLAAPLAVLGIYSILPFPSYDCDCVFSILLLTMLLRCLPEDFSETQSSRMRIGLRFFIAGAAIPLPLFFKQNIGVPLLAATFVLIFAMWVARRLRSGRNARDHRDLFALASGAVATLAVASLLLHFTCGIGNYVHWTIRFAAQRRLPGFADILGVYAEPSLLWWLPCVAAALLLLRCRLGRLLWARLLALGLLAAPLGWTLTGLLLSSDAEDRAGNLLALWPVLLVLSAALTLSNLWRDLGNGAGVKALIPAILLVTINGTLLSQQLWGSTYAIWPLLMILAAEMIAFVASIEPGNEAEEVPSRQPFTAPALAAAISLTLAICGGFYMASEERLSYAKLEGPVERSSEPALKGMAVAGRFLPEFEELLHFAASEIPESDGVILIPGEDPFYFATGRVPQFPVLLFDKATDPLSPAELVEEARKGNIRWLIVKRDLQINEDPTPDRAVTIDALEHAFTPYRRLNGYDIYRRR